MNGGERHLYGLTKSQGREAALPQAVRFESGCLSNRLMRQSIPLGFTNDLQLMSRLDRQPDSKRTALHRRSFHKVVQIHQD